jgi:phosphosulfolactate synthase (CoM biosynthesis protein A)
MKTFNVSKEKTDNLQQLLAVYKHYQIVKNMADKEIATFVISSIFPEIGLTAEDFGFCNIDIVNGKIDFDDEKKSKYLEEKGKKNA